ncbi:MAG: aminopeptidase P family protein [Lactobacillus sp.]|jgi:Xaa-Pro aminopeptidase|nr:aminopeptidase P family protein [Lactobacillus sp.]MCH3906099.1 aminopeptidase P family protein [Lactobacillus sp.]MCH3990323.1 aminopeptidase P family protein [Lactobacillus sp.]MCH4068962.1 aminopeptidase P family protein [Lactobacillus sp.]MCI1303364.1 aminopeptidase P family protein [Lactobacillus sp.]
MEKQELLSLLQTRINRVTAMIKERQADALLVTRQINYRYLTNFTGEEAQLILTASGDRFLYSDSRFDEQIKAQAPGEMTVIMRRGDWVVRIAEAFKKLTLHHVLVEGEFIGASEFAELKATCPDVEFTLTEQLVERARNVKDAAEQQALRKAIDLSAESFKEILPEIKPGVTERSLAAKLDYLFKVNGGDGPSFDTILASGYRSAWAHGVASDKKIQAGELVVIDFGSYYHGYTADITRTVAIGQVEPELEKIYHIVYEAQRRGIAAAVDGNTGRQVDQAARSYIEEQGYGQYFGHGIGHGIGLEIHELCSPAFPFGKEKLQDGIIHTVEPGIYLPGKGGVRIEDDVLVNGQHPETLSKLPKKDLLVL